MGCLVFSQLRLPVFHRRGQPPGTSQSSHFNFRALFPHGLGSKDSVHAMRIAYSNIGAALQV